MANPSSEKLAILAGGGKLPELLIAHAVEENILLEVITFHGQPQPQIPEGVKVTEFGLGSVGGVLKFLKANEVSGLVMAGALSKPSLFDLKLDVTGIKLLASIKNKHDDAILSALCKFFEEHEMKVLGAHEVMPQLLAPEGTFSKKTPGKDDLENIKLGAEAARTLGKLDIGQAAIVKEGVVLGVEGVEGTNALIERCAALRGKNNKGGILVKCAKPSQDLRVDMPTVGAHTIEELANLGYSGLAVSAGTTLVIDKEAMVSAAGKAGIFLYGI